MGTCSTITSQGLLFLLGLCFWAASGGLIYLSVELLTILLPLDGILDDTAYLVLVCWAVIGSTFFLFVLGIISFFAACCDSRSLQFVFFILLLLGFGGLIASATFCLLSREQIQDDISTTLYHALSKYDSPGDDKINDGVDFLQTNYECCGVHTYTDWRSTDWGLVNRGMVPTSCCKNDISDCTGSTEMEQLTKINQNGCEGPLHDNVMYYLIMMTVITIVTASINLVGMSLSCVRLCAIDIDNVDQTYNRLAEDHRTPQVSMISTSRHVQTEPVEPPVIV